MQVTQCDSYGIHSLGRLCMKSFSNPVTVVNRNKTVSIHHSSVKSDDESTEEIVMLWSYSR